MKLVGNNKKVTLF